MKVDNGIVIPRVLWIRFWTSRTALMEIGSATLVSGAGSGLVGAADLGAGGGGASLMLLRSR